MNATSTNNARFAAMRHRNFTLLWAGLIVSNVGTWMQNVASGWLILQITNSPLWLGLLGLSFALPMIVLPLVGGAITDRVNRIKLLYFTQTMMMLAAFALAALTWLGLIRAWHILAASLIGAALLAFDNPARQSLIPDLVPPQDLLNAISLNSATYNGAALLGPALAGAILGPLGAGWLFFINGVSFLAVLYALTRMRAVKTHSAAAGAYTSAAAAAARPANPSAEQPPEPASPQRVRHSLGKSMLAGFSHAWQNGWVRTMLALSALSALFGRSYQNLLPIFARDIWNSGPQGYGLLLSAAGAGALVGAFGLASIRIVKRQGTLMAISGLTFSASLIAFALSPSFWPGFALLFIGGVASTVFGTIIATFIQLAAPAELRGRVMSLYAITLIGLPSLGALGSGAVAEWLGGISGAPRAVLMGAVVLAAILVVVAPSVWGREMSGPPQK